MNYSKLFLIINIIYIISVLVYSFLPNAFENRRRDSEIANYNGEHVTFKAFVCQEADLSNKTRRLVLCASGKVLVTTDLYPNYDYGDYVLITGRLQEPEVFSDFNYPMYLAKENIFSTMYYPKIELLEKDDLSGTQRINMMLIRFRQNSRGIINRNLQEPQAQLASAMLFGYRRGINRDDLDLFSQVGIRHLIAISGAHISIISAMLLYFLRLIGLSKRRAIIPIIAFFIIFPLVTGLSSSTIRSSIMGLLGFIAFYFNRQANISRALIYTATIMLLINPMLLRYDIGFQLSFAAVLGIIYFEPILRRYTDYLVDCCYKEGVYKKMVKMIVSLFNLTISAQVLSLPIMISNFNHYSLVSKIANIYLSWLLMPILVSLIMAIILTSIIPGLGIIFFYPADIFLRFLYFTASQLSKFKYGYIELGNINIAIYFIYYLLIFVIFKKYNKKPQKGFL